LIAAAFKGFPFFISKILNIKIFIIS
jgi:hypothetical protein